MGITLTRREAALLGLMLRQILGAAGAGATGQNLPDLLRAWMAGLGDKDPDLAALVRRVLALVKEWPVSLRVALIQERCRLRALENDLLCLEVDSQHAASDRATA